MRMPILPWLIALKRWIPIFFLLFSLVACSGSPPTVRSPLLECRDPIPTAQSDSDELARNMRGNKNIIDGQPVDLPPSLINKGYFGKPQPCVTDTHHIVPIQNQAQLGTDVVQAVILSKEILGRYEIDLNSAVNGVYTSKRKWIAYPWLKTTSNKFAL